MSRNMRTAISMVGASVAHVLLLLSVGGVRAQGSEGPAAPAAPAFPTMPPMPAMPAFPAEPAAPATPGWGEYGLHGSTHWGDEPAADCSELHIRLDGERPTIQSEERTVSK